MAGKELEPIICITRAKLTRCPKPPQLLKEWLKLGWETVKAEVDLIQTRNFRDEERGGLSRWGSVTMTRGLSPSTIGRLLARDGLKLSVRLFRHANSSRRSTRYGRRCSAKAIRLELVVADGMLCVEEHLVEHPVLLQRISLDFDPSMTRPGDFCTN